MSNEVYTKLKCPLCGKEFHREHPNQKYCSTQCALKVHAAAQNKYRMKRYYAARDARKMELASQLIGETDINKIMQLLDKHCIMKRE